MPSEQSQLQYRDDTMGHTGSIQRSSRRHVQGTLYGEPVGGGAATAGGARPQYTPAQMQALYLSRGRPDMAFMSNQAMLPKEVPEMQQTSTVKNHVNLKKSSLRLISVDPERPDRFALEFEFDATKPCHVLLYVVAAETVDDETGCSSFALVHPHALPVVERRYPEGLNQKFRLGDGEEGDGGDSLLDIGVFSEQELMYEPGSSVFPVIIVLEVDDTSKKIQSQSTFATLQRLPTGAWGIKMLKQKILVDGLTYELQEIYGIDGAVAAAPAKQDGDTGDNPAPSGEIEIPDGAECIICLSEPRNTTVLPCRHMCLCSECAEALRQSSSTCPICRTRVEALLQIRVESKDAGD